MNQTYAQINLNNLRYNYNSIRAKTKTKVMAVVKADAYGHGMVPCASALSRLKNKPEYYGVALLDEAIDLRKQTDIREPILVFAPFNPKDYSYFHRYGIMPSITSEDQLDQLLNLKFRKKLRLQVNINTGMNRLGIKFDSALELIKKINLSKLLILDGIYTHFATSDEKNKKFAELQLNRFTNIIENLKAQNINYGMAHTANSGAILDMPEAYFDMVRPGVSLYGYYPSLETSESIKLKPVMSIKSELSTISEIKKNESIGYGRIYKTKRNIIAGTIPIGYADGFLRGLSNKAKVIIKDKKYLQVGRVSMDRISIDLKNDRFKTGQEVILLGKSKNVSINAWDWSRILNTIPYEITCSISKRVPRKYVGKSELNG